MEKRVQGVLTIGTLLLCFSVTTFAKRRSSSTPNSSLRGQLEPGDPRGLSEEGNSCPYEDPYGDGKTYLQQGDNSYQCHSLSPNDAREGCHEIHKLRMLEAWNFANNHHTDYVRAAEQMDLIHSLFDKSRMIAGAENYEMLDKYQIDCLMSDNRDSKELMFNLEDKGKLKEYAKEAFKGGGGDGLSAAADADGDGLSAEDADEDEYISKAYFTAYCDGDINEAGECIASWDIKDVEERMLVESGAMTDEEHTEKKKNQYSRSSLLAKLEEMCNEGVEEFLVKPTHLSWSTGLLKQEKFSEICNHFSSQEGASWDTKNVKERMRRKETVFHGICEHVEERILKVRNRPSDKHLNKLPRGFTVEELFRTEGLSNRPIEAKVHVLFGKVYEIIFVGQDPRGCTVGTGAWAIFGDGTGWHMNGKIGGEMDAMHDAYMNRFHEKVVMLAEKFANHAKADWTRVDFFLSGFGLPGFESDVPVIKLNEIENVSGYKFMYERAHLGRAWREGYISRDAIGLETSYGNYYEMLTKQREAVDLDSIPNDGLEEDEDNDGH